MSGTASVPNTFAAAVTATGAQLDANYSTVVAYLNDPTNRSNYAADAGTTNTVVLTFSPPVVGGYTAGLDLSWKWAATNSGATVLNANGLGNISVVNPDGSALNAGTGKIGSIGRAVYDGTRAIYISQPAQQPGQAKAWAYWSGTATGAITPLASFNVASIIKGGDGTYTVALTTPFATTAWAALVMPVAAGGIVAAYVNNGTQTASSAVVVSFNSGGSAADMNFLNFAAYGSQ